MNHRTRRDHRHWCGHFPAFCQVLPQVHLRLRNNLFLLNSCRGRNFINPSFICYNRCTGWIHFISSFIQSKNIKTLLYVGSKTGPHIGRAKRDWRKTTRCWQVAVLSKGTYLRGLSWMATRWVDLCTRLQKPKSLYKGHFNGVIMFTIQMVSTIHCSQGCVLQNSSHCGNSGRAYVPSTRERMRTAKLLKCSSCINQ